MTSRADRVIAFAEQYICAPEGKHIGKPIVLEKFQKKFIRDVYRGGVRKAILSMPRKNGKTALIAIILLAHLIGPEAKRNTQIISGALSRDQAALVFDLACKMINLSPDLQGVTKIVPSGKKIYGLPMNVEYKAISAEGKTAHGLSPVLAILDETGQVTGPRSDFIDAILTSQGAHENPLLICISTQAASDGDLLSIWIDDALVSDDPGIVCHLYAADAEAELLDEAQWYKANPALGKFRSLDDLREQMLQASRMPSMENTVRNLLLNQRISVNNPFVSKTMWMACNGNPCPIEDCDEVFVGLDLSGKTDLTAAVAVGHNNGVWNCYPLFWTPEMGLHDRAKRDRAPYDVWVKQGFLKITPGATVDYEFVLRDLLDFLSGVNLTAIAYDRWRMDILKKEIERLEVELPLEEWGQGFKDMAPALDALEEKILNATLRHGGHPVLTMCAANAMIVKNPAGDRKIDKMKTSGRIDGIVALAMACGMAQRKHEPVGDINSFLNAPLVI